MRVFIAGNMGYVGAVLVAHLRKTFPECEIHGFDNAYFAHCLVDGFAFPERLVDVQHFGDVRDINPRLLDGFDAVVQLAAVSNDPMGNEFKKATETINRDASVALAVAASHARVRSFVFASSCSVYGVAQGPPRKETDPACPETVYARSKVEAEAALAELGTTMTITALRFATACGASPRLRLDLVLNDFVAAAVTDHKIVVLSDGSPWRPLIDVADMALAMEWALGRPLDQGGRFLIVNTGASDHNYQIRELANAVAAAVPGTEVLINSAAPVDSRSYQVDFSLYERLAPNHRPRFPVQRSIQDLVGLIYNRAAGHREVMPELIRMNVLQQHIKAKRLTPDLQWVAS